MQHLNIRTRRKALGISQKQLAADAGISTSYLNLIESGNRPLSDKLLKQIAKILGGEALLEDNARQQSQANALRYLFPDTHVENFVANEPEWAQRLIDMRREILNLQQRLAKQSSPLDHDEYLHDQLHELLSHATSLLSISNLLNTHGNIPAETKTEFHIRNEAEAQSLSKKLRELVVHFESEREETNFRYSQSQRFFDWLHTTPNNLADFIERAQNDLTRPETKKLIQTAIATDEDVEWVTFTMVERLIRDLDGVAITEFVALGTQTDWDFAAMTATLDWKPDRLLRVFAMLSPQITKQPTNIMIVDQTGMVWLAPSQGRLALERDRNCAYWPDQSQKLADGKIEHAQLIFDDDHSVNAFAAQSTERINDQANIILRTMISIEGLWPHSTSCTPITAGLNCKRCQKKDCGFRRRIAIVS